MINEIINFDLGLKYPPYPPYHKGDYLEQYFKKFYINNQDKFDETGYDFISLNWTEIYNHRQDLFQCVQTRLLDLNPNKKYFIVSQHDDAPKFHQLPKNTVVFSAGGNADNTHPIPLICSPIVDAPIKEKNVFCSFIGSATHPIRMEMLRILVNHPEYVLKPKHWTPEIKEERMDLFLDLTSRSKFALCPRGYGASSFRLYESMQLNAVPVFIYDKPFHPFLDKINWNDICVNISVENLKNLDKILKAISDDEYNQMLLNIKDIYPKYFTMDAVCNNILRILTTINK